MPRYVLLHHTGCPGRPDHYDLMLEREGVLKTWQVQDPDLAGGTAIESFDHRLRYLDYEGEISGGRGRVRRVAAGEYEVLEWRPGYVRIRLGNRVVALQTRGRPGNGSLWRAEVR